MLHHVGPQRKTGGKEEGKLHTTHGLEALFTESGPVIKSWVKRMFNPGNLVKRISYTGMLCQLLSFIFASQSKRSSTAFQKMC